MSELKTWWKELVVAITGPMVVFFSIQLGWGVAAVVGIVILVVGVAFFFYDLGGGATSRAKREVTASPGETKERVLETVVMVDSGEDYALTSYHFERGDRILLEAQVEEASGPRFSLLVIHESELGAYEIEDELSLLTHKNNTTRHRERVEIPESGLWYFIVESEEKYEDVSVELSIWKLK